MSELWIDGKTYPLKEGDDDRNLLEVCLSLGLDVPYFCWHPDLGSVGACRQCAIKQYEDEEDADGRIAMACMTPAESGARISIEDPEVRSFRASVIEWMMVNHPHDCPVCDEGGECHLQDMTVMTGHHRREFRFPKRTFRNQDLGPLVNHEMNRCIQCYRCVRFYDRAGGSDLQAFASHDHVYFGRHEDGALESPFAGNLVEVCPTGVFTDKRLKKDYARKWDLQAAPSICPHCSVGCNTLPGERYGRLRRVRNRYHPEVNGYWLCDRGRYGFEHVHHERRLETALRPRGPEQAAEALDPETAVTELGRILADGLGDGGEVAGIGSPRASLESNLVLRRLVGPARFHPGLDDVERARVDQALEILRRRPTPSLREVEEHDGVLILGQDPLGATPLLALALQRTARRAPAREAEELDIPAWNDLAVDEVVQGRTGPFVVATPAPTGVDELATETFRATPAEIAELGFEVARAVGVDASEGSGTTEGGEDEGIGQLARRIAASLRKAERPLVISGVDGAHPDVLPAAAAVSEALGAPIFLALPEANTMGAALSDRSASDENDASGAPGPRSLRAVLQRAAAGEVGVLIVVENDLYRRAPKSLVDRALEACEHVVVLDHLAHDTGARASLLLPAAPVPESAGTFVNHETRAQRFLRVHRGGNDARESWRWLRDAALEAGRDGWGDLESLHDLLRVLVDEDPTFEGVEELSPRVPAGVPRQSHRFSGRTAMTADRDVRERRPRPDPDSPLRDSMEGAGASPPPSLITGYRVPGWNSVQALNRFQEEVAGPLRARDGDGAPGVRLVYPRRSLPRGESRSETGRTPREAPRGDAGKRGSLPLVPLREVFGSDETSALAPGIAALAPAPAFVLAPETSRELGLAGGDPLELEASLDGETTTCRAPLRILDGMASGVVGVPLGLDGGWIGPLPERGRLALADVASGNPSTESARREGPPEPEDRP